MQPTLQTRTSAGLETPQQTLDRAGSMLATSRTPAQLAAPAFSLNLPDEIPSTALRNSTTFEDVLAKRNRAEQDQFASQQLSTDYQNLFGRIGDTQNTPLSNPEDFINRLLLNRPTDTQNALDTVGQNQAQNTRDFAGDYAQAGTEARQQFAIPELQGNLAETRNRIAERTVQLRQTLRDFETNSLRRGMDRHFLEAQKQAVREKAAAELADLSIIENAQLGNLQQAQGEVDSLLAEKQRAFEMENMAIEQEIARLEKMDTREADIRKEQLTIALGERSRNIETALANEKEARGYLIEAANNGADNGTLDAIRNAKTPGEAAMLAGPWVGRLDRELKNAQIANTYDAIRQRQVALQKAQQEATTEEQKSAIKKEAESDKALEIKKLASELLLSPGFNAAVGAGFKKNIVGALPFVSGDAIPGTARADFEAQADRLANLLTLDNLDLMSGVLSETDVKILETSGSNLKNRNLSEAAYKAEVNRVIETMNRTISNNGVTEEQALFWGVVADENELNTVSNIWAP